MTDYLLIRAGADTEVIEALAVAADLVDKFGDEVQIDIATTEALVDCAKMGRHIRRVIAIPSLATDTIKDMTKPAGVSWKDKLLSSTKAVKSFVQDNSKNYWAMSETLRLVRYDVVFDLDMTTFSLSTTKIAKKEKIIGFDSSGERESMTGASLLYHDCYQIPHNISSMMRRRQLVARHFSYTPNPLQDSYINDYQRLQWLDDSPYILLSGNVPNVFTDVLDKFFCDSNFSAVRVLGGKYGYPDSKSGFTIEETAALAQHAVVTIGNGLESVLSSASGKPTCFIGDEAQKMDNAILITSTEELLAHLKQLFPCVETPPETPPENTDSTTGTGKKMTLKKP